MNHETFFDHGLEQATLGALASSPSLLPLARAALVERDFHSPACAEVFRALLSLESHNQPVTLVTLRAEMTKANRSRTTEWDCPLPPLFRMPVTQAILDNYFARLLALSAARQTFLTAKACTQVSAGVSPEQYLDRCRKAFETALKPRQSVKVVSMVDAMLEFDNQLQRILTTEGDDAVSSGLRSLDWQLAGGFRPGQLWVLAARPGVGKTALALKTAVHNALAGKSVVFFSLEMLRVELVQRACCDWGSVDWQKIKARQHDEQDLAALAEAQQALSRIPLAIFDQSSVRVEEVRATCLRLRAQQPVDLLVIDYLQLLKTDPTPNRSDAIGASAAALKALAKELNCPVLVLSQFNRASEQRTSKKPLLSDLRGSGEIEQHADGVLILHRPELYKPGDPQHKGLAEVSVAKNRSGSTGIVECGFEAEFTRFYDLPNTDNVVPLRKPNNSNSSNDDYLETPHWQEEA